MKRVVLAVLGGLLMLPGTMGAQNAGTTMAFDVVSIRQNTSDVPPDKREVGAGPTADGFHIKNLPAGVLLLSAYAPSVGGAAFFNPQQITGMPDWMMRDRYDVDARVGAADMAAWQDPAKQPEMLHAMLQQMLEQRMKLKVHREMKDVPVYELTVAKGGLKGAAQPSKAAPGADTLKGARVQTLPGGAVVMPGSKPGEYKVYNATMASLGVMLQNLAGRPIQNHTGLDGGYDLTFQLDEEPGMSRQDMGAMLVDALGELGLKLQPAKGQVETLVVDHAETPTEN